MAENHKDGLQIYSSGITNLVTISAAGLAAGTALMQIAGAEATNKPWYLASLVLFFFGLIGCFFTMSGITGQAISKDPNIQVSNIRIPALISFILACIGFILLVVGAIYSPAKHDGMDNSKLIQKLEICRSETGITAEQRLRCYDSLFDTQVSGTQITNEELQTLPENDRAWIKTLILKTKTPK